ncbi:hypothetical protein GCM10023188_25800 [Pontibacter saemangeumensis]|uniref:Uncharacterized protein n=1 Tax=Pontibacter saemangeumensis TaxID=1084525 RepID=A0ABP8LRL0_9BACT
MELYIEGQRTDLSPDQVFAVTVQSNDITKPDTVQSSYSNTLTLPFTEANHAALGHAAEPTSQHHAPYRKLEALVLADGVEVVAHPKAYLEQAGEGYELQLFSGALDFLARLGDKSIRDLDLSRYNHLWDFQGVKEGARYYRDYTYGYIYDAIDNGKPFSPGNLWAEDRHPSVFVRAVFEQMLSEAGVSYTGIEDVLWDRLILPFSNDKPVHNQAWRDARAIDSDTRSGLPLAPVPVDYGIIEASFVFEVDFISESQPSFIALSLKQGGLELQRRELAVTTTGRQELKATFEILPCYELAGLEIVSHLTNLFPSGSSGTSTYTSRRLTVNYKEDAFYKTEWDVALNLPDIKQKDFFKAVRALFDLMPSFDPYSNTMTLTAFNRLQENIPMALDWSGKLVYVDSRKPAVQYRFGDFAQKSWWRYKADERGGNGDAYLAVDDHQLEPEKDVLTLPFAASEDVDGFLRIPLFSQIEDKPDFSKETDSIDIRNRKGFEDTDLVLVKNATADPLVREGWATYERIEGRPYSINGWVLRDQQAYHYKREKVEPRIAVLSEEHSQLVVRMSRAYAVQVVGKSSSFLPISFTELLPTRYTALQGVLTRCKGITPYFLLTPQDVAGYDPGTPIWLAQYQDYFYLNQISEYTGKAPTACQLWRL